MDTADWRMVLQNHVAGIDHIAIAVPDLEASLRFYEGVLGFEVLDRRETRGESTGMQSAVVRLGGSTIVLVQGTEPDSQVTRFVREHGAGVQHIALEVRDLDAAVEALEARGTRFEMPMIEGSATRQIFTTRHDSIGVRIELIERTGPGFDSRSVERLFRAMERRGVW